MLNIVVPMAGHGSRFSKAGYMFPKPLIPILGKPMIQIVIENLKPSRPHHFIFVCQQEHLDLYGLGKLLSDIAPGCDIVPVSKVTEGAACTVLLTKDLINNNTPLMIANCDQYINAGIDDYLAAFDLVDMDGWIMTMSANDPKWSYILLDEQRNITKVVEKEVVSNEATVGIYNYSKGQMFVAAAEAMISKNLHVNREFYVAPAYDQMIKGGARVGFYNIGTVENGMHGLGTPADLEIFLGKHLAKK
jgi:dTDP-glucose pyrophosphorylase